jgi:rhodanese-related sulfurtransferase
VIEKEPLQVKELLDSGTDMVLVDVREKWEFEYCHIPNSIHISVSDIPDNISKLETKKPLLLVCHNGRRSRHIGEELIKKGFRNLINLKGGVDQWADDIDKSMPKYGMKEIIENS